MAPFDRGRGLSGRGAEMTKHSTVTDLNNLYEVVTKKVSNNQAKDISITQNNTIKQHILMHSPAAAAEN
jgi:hypothetical protein